MKILNYIFIYFKCIFSYLIFLTLNYSFKWIMFHRNLLAEVLPCIHSGAFSMLNNIEKYLSSEGKVVLKITKHRFSQADTFASIK